MSRPRLSGKRRRGKLSLFDHPQHFKPVPRSKETINFFQEQPEYKPALLLFKNRDLVPKGEIERVSRDAIDVLISKGIICGQKGGRWFKLKNTAKEALAIMQQ